MDSGGVCTKTGTQYQLVLNVRVGQELLYRVNSKDDEKNIYCTITLLRFPGELFSSSGSRASVWECATWFCHVERSGADHFSVLLKYQDLSPQVSLPGQAGRSACYIPSRSDLSLLVMCQLHHKYGCTYRWLAVPLQCGTFLMYQGVLREISDIALSCC